MSPAARRLALLLAAVAVVFAGLDRLVFPAGLPRAIPALGWKAEDDKYLYALASHGPAVADELTVCVLGSSLVQKGMHAATLETELGRAIGRPSQVYNFGIGGAYMCDILLSLHYALQTHPDFVVIGTSLRDYPQETLVDPKGTASYELLYDPAFAVPDFMALSGVEERIDSSIKNAWNFFRFRNWIRMNAGALFRAIADPAAQRERLFFAANGAPDWGELGRVVGRYYDQSTRRYPNAQVSCLERVLGIGENSGTRLLVVNMPVSSVWFALDERGMQPELDRLLRSVGAENGVDYIDAAQQHPDADFIDSSHLNREGALSFSRWLAREIAARIPATTSAL